MTSNVIHVKSPLSKKKFFKICDCEKEFHTSSYYFRHKKKCEAVLANELPSQSGNFTCLEKNCIFKAKFSNTFMDHMKTVHNIQHSEEYKVFQAYSEFKNWMKIFEEETKSSFLLSKRSKTETGRTEYFYCSRSGKYCPQAMSPRKRALKAQGSKKIGFNCPASIRVHVTIQPEKVIATINAFHYGHENNLYDIAIPKNPLIKIKKGSSTKETTEICEHHTAASGLSASFLHKISSNVWKMKSDRSINTEVTVTDDLFYKIVKLSPCKSNCKIKCQQCNICLHSYTCNCPDGLTGTTICKHIHFVAQQNEEIAAVSNICDSDMQDNSNDDNGTGVTSTQDSDNSDYENKDCSEEILGLPYLDDVEIIRKSILEKNKLIHKQIKSCTDRNLLLQARLEMNNFYNVFVLSANTQ